MSFGPLKHFRFSRRPPFFKISSKFELLNPDRPIAAVNSFDDKAGPITVLEKGQVEVINNMEKLKPQKSLSPPKVENQETLKKRRLRKASAVKFFRPESTEGNPNAQTQVEGEKVYSVNHK